MKKLDYTISCVCAKQLLEPMRTSVTYLQGNLRFKMIEEIIHTYKEIREKTVELTQSCTPKLLVGGHV